MELYGEMETNNLVTDYLPNFSDLLENRPISSKAMMPHIEIKNHTLWRHTILLTPATKEMAMWNVPLTLFDLDIKT